MRTGLFVATIMTLALAACSGSGSAPPDERSLVLSEFVFSPDPLEMPAGRPVALVMRNTGTVEHDVVIGQIGLNVSVKPGGSARRQLAGLAPGTYEVLCTVPGHREAGMVSKLVVK